MLIAAFETGHIMEENIDTVYSQISSKQSRELGLKKGISSVLREEITVLVYVPVSLTERLQFI